MGRGLGPASGLIGGCTLGQGNPHAPAGAGVGLAEQAQLGGGDVIRAVEKVHDLAQVSVRCLNDQVVMCRHKDVRV